MENLEMSGNLSAVREMSEILLKVREVSGKKILSGKSRQKMLIGSCIFASILDFAELPFGFGSCTVAFLPHH